MANWKTALFGGILSITTLAHGVGITIGHIGSVDVVTAAGAVAALFMGFYAKDKNVTGGNTPNNIQ